ncbi:MAG: hypothetical protein K8R19_07010, partial [Methanosarcinales archaeon]|nr:hypothetical protein [Methanosarcinales archaeon]
LVNSCMETVHISYNHMNLQRVERTGERSSPVSHQMCDTLRRPKLLVNLGQSQRFILIIPGRPSLKQGFHDRDAAGVSWFREDDYIPCFAPGISFFF